MKKMLSTKEVARFIGVNEKMVYSLVAEKGLPATKITGKWLFPRHLEEQWIEANTINFPDTPAPMRPGEGLLIITGSNDPLLERTITLFNSHHPDHLAVFGTTGSMGGLSALRRNLCHIASSHLLSENKDEYNFEFAERELDKMPAVVNFCRRQQGILVAKGNPKGIKGFGDLGKPNVRMVNRPLGTGTRLLLDRELKAAGVKGEKIPGYHTELARHLDVGMEILSGRADAGPAIGVVAHLLGLDFIPCRWESFDLMIPKEKFFHQGVQRFLGLLHDKPFRALFDESAGYDLSMAGKMVYPGADDDEA